MTVPREPIDIVSPAFRADPFPTLAWMRAERPLYRAALPDRTPVWLLTRHEDVSRLLKDDRFAKCRSSAMTPQQLKRYPWVPPMFRPLERNMLDLDPPDHGRLRSLVQKAFTPRLVDEMRPRIQALADELLDACDNRGGMDLIRNYALPIPMTIISEILGVPPADRARFHRWSRTIVSVDQLHSNWRVLPAVWNFTRYLKRYFRMRRARPADDLVSVLIQVEEAGDRLGQDELLAMAFLLLIAGHETTVNLIGSGVLALLENLDQKARLADDPSLLKPAVEELLRYTAPVFLTSERYPRQDVEMHGATIPRGEMTMGVIASANRDASVFPHPDRLDISRDASRHLSFGHGIHFCLGAPLARLEAQIAIETLFRRLPGLRLEGPRGSLKWRRSLILRGLESLPVAWPRSSGER